MILPPSFIMLHTYLFSVTQDFDGYRWARMLSHPQAGPWMMSLLGRNVLTCVSAVVTVWAECVTATRDMLASGPLVMLTRYAFKGQGQMCSWDLYQVFLLDKLFDY